MNGCWALKNAAERERRTEAAKKTLAWRLVINAHIIASRFLDGSPVDPRKVAC